MRTQAKLVPITGNTYPVKDQLRALGCRWNAEEKCWMAPADKEKGAKAIVAGAGAKKPYSGARRSSGFGGGRRNGCYMGCREGNPNPRCRSCCFDEYDN